MINHARTLLMNRSGGNQNFNELGEEYISESFVAQSLPPWMKSYQQALFGARPENIYRNFQADKLLRIVHATEYERYLTLFDNRLTYNPHTKSPFSEVQYGYTLTEPTGKVIEVSPANPIAADEARGVMRRRWTFNVSATGGEATVVDMLNGTTSTVYILGNPAVGMRPVSDVFTLPGSSFNVRLRITPPYPVGAWESKFEIALLTRPTKSLTDKIIELESLRELERRLFGYDVVEPYVTFFGLWRTGKTLPDRITGIVLALLYRLHANYRTGAS